MSLGENPRPTKTQPAAELLKAGRSSHVGLYPHDLHPGLVPGLSVEDQNKSFSLDRVVFFVTATLIVAFIAWGIASPESVSTASAAAYDWAMNNAAWLLNLVMSLGIIVMIYLAFSRYGQIPLGRDDEQPEFSRYSWIAMMFGAGIGVGVFFFGPSEPLAYYLSPPPETVAAETPAALHQALAQSHFHWGLSIWGLYALVGGALAYSTYRRGRPSLLSSVFRPLLGTQPNEGIAGRVIDMMAIVATLFGTAATLGLSALQIAQGVEIISGAGPLANNAVIAIIGVLGVAFIISAVSGVARGIRYLSNINIALTLLLVAFVFLFGPSLFLLNLVPSGVATYIDQLLPMMGKSLSWGQETLEFQGAWTAFYWAWWIAWTPFVGMFIARISRGRTIREFALATIAGPTAILVLAFTIFGGASITFSREGREMFDGSANSEQILFALFDQLPLNTITPFLLIAVLTIFFVTSADSASVVMGTMSSQGNPAPKKLVIVFWGACMMGIATVMLLAGGETALTALQNLTILIALPFSIVLLLMTVAFLKDLRTDPAAIRKDYASTAVENAVVRGLEEHGDDFEFTVASAPEGRGAGAHFDSSSENVTDWYQRVDEEGEEIAYDHETKRWADQEDNAADASAESVDTASPAADERSAKQPER